MSFATRMWARRLVNATATANSARTFLRPRAATPLKAYQPFRTMATAAQKEYVDDIPITTITEDKDFGRK
jgi:NADH dehydrogenase (ubiquinone) Fe-S protein 2